MLLLFDHQVKSNLLWPHELQHARLFCPPLSPGVYSNSCPLSQWCYLTISSFAVPFSFGLQFFQALGSFPMSQLFTSGGQSIAASASASVLPMNIQDWFSFRIDSFYLLLSKGLLRVFSSTTVKKHQFFSTQLSSQSNSHIHTRSLKCPLNYKRNGDQLILKLTGVKGTLWDILT